MEILATKAMDGDAVGATTPIDLAVSLFRLAGRTESTFGLRFDLHRRLKLNLWPSQYAAAKG